MRTGTMNDNNILSGSTPVSKRLMSEIETRAYTGLGRTSVRRLGEELNCIHHYGRRILYDKNVIDAYLDNQLKTKASDQECMD